MRISDWSSDVCSSDLLGSVLSTLGAIIFLSGKSVSFLASEIGLAALPVALLAGFESIGGVLLAGIIVGIIQGLVMAYVDPVIEIGRASCRESVCQYG